jgi:hypothetical protein
VLFVTVLSAQNKKLIQNISRKTQGTTRKIRVNDRVLLNWILRDDGEWVVIGNRFVELRRRTNDGLL